MFELYFHDRELGWNRRRNSAARGDLDRFPDVQFSDPRVKIADMSGDGLQDIVFVSTGSVDYWPYLGNGNWGQRVHHGWAHPLSRRAGGRRHRLRSQALLLGDVDGDGVSDMVYVESGRITIWLNQSGNRWSDPIVIHGTPPISDVDSVRLVDVLGNGTDGILWTYDLRTFGDSTYKFLDLTGGLKPYLLQERNNHAGARTLVEYAPSTRFYVDDAVQPETRWRTRLPFAVQVVARVEVIDEISGGKLATEYRYHQGYWDGDEREFRGFGMVEQFDTETFDDYHANGLHGSQRFNSVEPVHFSPPTLTRTWFHQGQVQDSAGTWSESDYAVPLGRMIRRCSDANSVRNWTGIAKAAAAECRAESAPPRAARSTRLDFAHRTVRTRQLAPSRPPVHRHRGPVRRPRDRTRRAWQLRPAEAFLPVPDREPNQPMGARHRTHDPVRFHERP